MFQNVAWMHSEPTYKNNVIWLFGANLALAVQAGSRRLHMTMVLQRLQGCLSQPRGVITLQKVSNYFVRRLNSFFRRFFGFSENMLGLRMLQKTNFPTSMGKSLVIDTINCTSPLQPLQGCLSQPRGVIPLQKVSEILSSAPELIFSRIFWFQWKHVGTQDASEDKLSYFYGQEPCNWHY